MNASRVARLLRELADAFEEGEPANDAPRPTPPKKAKRRRPVRRVERPEDVADLDVERARAAARRQGIVLR